MLINFISMERSLEFQLELFGSVLVSDVLIAMFHWRQRDYLQSMSLTKGGGITKY